MAAEPEDPILDAEDEGGPIKGFLEHLEDLRWVLLKSFSALFMAMLVCLFAAPSIVSLLKQPLEQSAKLTALYGNSVAEIDVRLGTNRIGTFKPGGEYAAQFAPSLNLATNQSVIVEIRPLVYGTNNFLTFTVNTNLSDEPARAPVELLNLTPAAGFFVALQVAFYGGLALSLPFILFFVAQFVLPALKVNELRYIRKAFVFGMGLFVMGVCLCYFGMLPIALKAAVWFSNQMGFGAFQWTADTYIGFVTKFILAMGLGFELPIFLLLFVKLGILDYKMLASNRKLVLVGILIVAAILTPPDVVTQIAMAIPLYGLFEITALIAWWWERKDKKLREEEEAAERAEAAAYKARSAAKNANIFATPPETQVSAQESQTQSVPNEGEVAYSYSQEAADKAAEQSEPEQVNPVETGSNIETPTAEAVSSETATEEPVKVEESVQLELPVQEPVTDEKTSLQIEEEYASQGEEAPRSEITEQSETVSESFENQEVMEDSVETEETVNEPEPESAEEPISETESGAVVEEMPEEPVSSEQLELPVQEEVTDSEESISEEETSRQIEDEDANQSVGIESIEAAEDLQQFVIEDIEEPKKPAESEETVAEFEPEAEPMAEDPVTEEVIPEETQEVVEPVSEEISEEQTQPEEVESTIEPEQEPQKEETVVIPEELENPVQVAESEEVKEEQVPEEKKPEVKVVPDRHTIATDLNPDMLD